MTQLISNTNLSPQPITKTTNMLYNCKGHWSDGIEFDDVIISDGSWNEIEDAIDEGIFYYTDGESIIGDHGDFVVVSAEPIE